MSKRKKISSFKKDRIKEFLININDDPYKNIDFTQFILDDDNLKLFKNLGKIAFYKSEHNKKECLVLYSIIILPIEKKDSIEVNDQIMNLIDFLEKLFTIISDNKIIKNNNFKTNEHLVYIKSYVYDSIDNILSKISFMN